MQTTNSGQSLNGQAGAATSFVMPGMYGVNFVEHLFKHLLEHGLEGAGLIFFSYYMYTSQDMFKEFFKYINEKISSTVKHYFELYGKKIIEWIKQLFTAGGVRCFEVIKKRVFDTKFFEKKKTESPPPSPKTSEDTRNKLTVHLNLENKIDLMAFGNFLMATRKHYKINEYHRIKSDKYKTTEYYQIPSVINLEQQHFPVEYVTSQFSNFSLEIKQNVDYIAVCETDGKNEIIRDVKFTIHEKLKEATYSEFDVYLKKMPALFSSYPQFKYENWKSQPTIFCNGLMQPILGYIYCTKNMQLFRKFYSFLSGVGTFDFCGKKWKLIDFSDYNDNLKDAVKFEAFIIELEKYCNGILNDQCNDHRDQLNEWISKHKSKFDSVILNNSIVSLTFASVTHNTFTLETISRAFINNMVTCYYNQHNESVGNKISTYQLSISYDQKKVQKLNPEFTEWEKKYGEKEKEREKKELEAKEKEAMAKNNLGTET